MLDLSLLLRERTASIREIQKNPTKALRGITRVMRGAKTHGFFLSAREMEEFIEDFEASQSGTLKQRVQEGRDIIKGGNYDDTHSLDDVLKKYEVSD